MKVAGTKESPSTYLRNRCPNCGGRLPLVDNQTCRACGFKQHTIRIREDGHAFPYTRQKLSRHRIRWSLFALFVWTPAVVFDTYLRLGRRLIWAVLSVMGGLPKIIE